MSRREWELGTITIPARQWKDFLGDWGIANDTVRMEGDDYLIGIDHTLRQVRWEVYEGNHACEYARATDVARRLFRALDRVKWTRGSGGEITGNNEYNQDSSAAGDGGNYVVKYYGPPKKRRSYR